ncbi:AimR family lysis-lysogeny pheromone receptor [Peribacillus sp. NPDC097198]|uniref:AimR family lysis-lysogeny pheromone receptor n=1 Tax=Peribacillus sp. NPDC097198 TaxID=3364397 RepID=UPI00380F0659
MDNSLRVNLDYTIFNNQRSLEYYDNNKLKKEKRILIDKMLQSKDRYDVEFATIYDIDDHYTSKRISSIQALNAYSDIIPSNRDVEIGVKLFKSYIYVEEQSVRLLDEYTMGLEHAIDSISDDYIRGMYQIRYSIISLASLVSKNYINEVRRVCKKIMNDNLDNYYSALVSVWYGNTFLLDEPEKTIEIYEEALKWANDSRCEGVRMNLKNGLDFANIMMGKQPKYLNFESNKPSEIHNIAFWYIKKGNLKVGEELLNTLNMDELNDVQKAYHHYYRGFIREPLKHFSQSLKHFKMGGEFYFRKLALFELKRLGLDENVIEALSV